MKIHGLQKLTLLDFPSKTACTVFTGGCNFRCPFCHNASLAINPHLEPTISEEEFFAFLNKRRGILDGVAITGGEPTINNDLYEFISKIKEMGFKVKLDTNGTNPKILKKLLDDKKVDFVAMDIKSSYENYHKAAGVKVDVEKIKESVKLVKQFPDYEFRTTVVKNLITVQDIENIANDFAGVKAFYLQNFKDSGNLIDPNSLGETKENMLLYKDILSKKIEKVEIRGLEV